MFRVMTAMVSLGATLAIAVPAGAQISVDISVGVPPPPLPVYEQPPLPGPDYIWTPGYWAWDDIVDDYYWVPGTWVLAPRPGLLWTPPWWGWDDGAYVFHSGYWGPHVGFYGGVPYGYGYTGYGFEGGYWRGNHVYYNRVVTNVTNVHITNIYQKNVVVNRVTRISYNGGPGGVQARPARQDLIAAHEAHLMPTRNQFQHLVAARTDPRAFVTANRGRPPLVATPRPLAAPGGPGRGMAPPDGRAAFRDPRMDRAMPVDERRGDPPPFARERPMDEPRPRSDVRGGGVPSDRPPPPVHGRMQQSGWSDRPAPPPPHRMAMPVPRPLAGPPRPAYHPAPAPRPKAPPRRDDRHDHHG
ncbi:hypothetical protein TPR58_20860 [Sphingomonas sp. HF-S3]|uniref:BcpO-related WXXGXW repeat protein n=1 Tax=Sphingomonas rustica TaxID=3103142 RepID=A0ABV0BGZ4_9SPHN